MSAAEKLATSESPDEPQSSPPAQVPSLSGSAVASALSGAAIAGNNQVALTGRLGGLNFPSVLQFLVFINKTGKLTVTNRNSQALFLFRNGRIVYSTSSSVRETLGNMLVCEQRISEEVLLEALQRQHKSSSGTRLGTILQEMGAVDQGTIEELLEQQTEKVIWEVAQWPEGFFKFELLEFDTGQTINVDAQDFFVEEGIRAEPILCRVAERIGELTAKRQGTDSDQETNDLTGDGEEPLSRALVSSWTEVLDEIRSPTFTAEVTLRLKRDAADAFDRAVIFLCRPGSFSGMAQVGIELETSSPDRSVRELRIPTDQPSILQATLESGEPRREALADNLWNRRLLAALGGGAPNEVVALPMKVAGEVVMILYADNLTTGRPISSTERLERMMDRLGVRLEKSLLELRVHDLEERLESLETGIGEPSPTDRAEPEVD